MLDSEFVAVGAETQARLTDLGVMPKPGGEGEQAKPDYRRQGPMRHDWHDGLRRGSRQPDPRADRLRGRLQRRFRPRVAAEAEEVGLSDADAYDRFMGRYSRPLAVPFADFAGLPLDGRVLDVGCGPGALTAELAGRAGPGRVTAVDPSEEFVAALRGRHPGGQVIRAPAEDLPFGGGRFAATLAQL